MTIATTEPNSAEMGAFNERDENVVRYLGLNPNSPADRAMVAVCRAYDFDPVLKHVVVIPKGGVYITRDGLLHVAHRSGVFDGMVVEQDPTLVNGEWVAKVSVYRKDMSHPFTYPGRYPVSGSNKQYAQEMALKAAEAHALRRAFDVSGLPTLDEQRPERHVTYVEQPAGDRMAHILGTQTSEPEASQADTPDSAAPPSSSVDTSGSESPLLDTSSKLAKAMYASLGDRGLKDAAAKEYISETVDRFIESTKELTQDEARRVLARLDEENGIEDAKLSQASA